MDFLRYTKFGTIIVPASGPFVELEQWERWLAKRKWVSGSNPPPSLYHTHTAVQRGGGPGGITSPKHFDIVSMRNPTI